MFKEFEDYVLAAYALYVGYKIGEAVYEVYNGINQLVDESAITWNRLTNKRYAYVIEKLDKTDASNKACIEAFRHAHMLIEREIRFYETNPVAREEAIAFNDRCLKSFEDVYSK